MRRRSRAGSKQANARRRKAATPKRPTAPTVRDRGPSSLKTMAVQLARERDEALEQLSATSEVLKVISASPGDLQPVFDTILERATQLCEASHGQVWRIDGGQLHAVAVRGDARFVQWLRQNSPLRPFPGSSAYRILRGEHLVHVADRREEDAYRNSEVSRELVDTSGIRASLSVALRRNETLLGMINVYRQEVRPFTERQIALVQNFAAQAVIAIENARLLNELRGRTQELTEALEQRTATSEVLGVISSSPGELTSVFDTILANALRLCEADTGHVLRAEAGALSIAAMRGGRPEYAQLLRERGPWRPPPDSAPAQTMERKKPVQIADMSQTSSYAAGGQVTVAAVELGGLRTVLLVPMIADEKAIGIIVIYRSVVRPFSDKQIALVENFAAQAVIAIENSRLLNELRQSLEQQTESNQLVAW
jgi:GAF domain-containing protein